MFGRRPRDELPASIAKACQKIFTQHGVETLPFGNTGFFELVIPAAQFHGKLPPIGLVCRSPDFISGALTFKDARDQSVKNSWQPVLLVTQPPDLKMLIWSRQYLVPVIRFDAVAEFASILREAAHPGGAENVERALCYLKTARQGPADDKA
jgi:hypothetical protein